MQIYVLNRARETLATTSSIYDDKHTLTLDAGSSSYEFKISKNDEASQYMDSGNYIALQNDNGKTWLFTILDYEETQYTKTVYAEDAGIELLNKACDIWKANGPHSFEYYFNIVTNGTPWKLGVNQLAGLERTLTYEGRDTGLGRLLSILKGFDNAECTFDVTVKMNAPSEFKINVYKQVGSDRSDVQMVYSHELNDIVKKESRAEFVTALCGVGGTVTPPEGQETAEQKNIDFVDLEYNKDGLVTTKGDKFLRAVDANKRFNPGQTTYIEAFYEYDTQSASELLNRTITRLKTYSEPQYTYAADVKIIDSTLKIGDTVTIIDHDYNPALYLSARVAKLEKSYTDPSQNTIEFCNYQLLSSRLADKLARLQTIVNKLPSASQVGKLESNVSDLSKKQDELASQITSANGKNTNFYGKTEPATPKNGDLWYKKLENGEIEMYQYQDGVWQLLASTAKMTTVQTELAQAKADITQAKTDAQNAYDEAIKATGTANGAKAETDKALKQAKQANDSYTTLAKEVADNKASVDADYKRVSDSYTALSKEVADNKTSADADYQKAQAGIVQAKTDAQNAYNEAVKATSAANGAKAETTKALEQAKQANNSYTALAKEVADNKTSVDTDVADIRKAIDANKASADADYKQAQADIAQAQKDLSSVTDTVTEFKKGQGELSAKVAGKVDNTVYQTYVKQTAQSLSEKLVASDLNGYAKTVDVTKSVDGVKTIVADNTGKISTMQTDIDGVKTSVANAQGDISTLQTDAKNIKATVSSNTGKIATMQADVDGIKTNVKNAQGDISTLQTDAKSIKATVSSNTGKITQLTTDVDGVRSSVSNKVDNTVYQSYVTQTDKALSAKLTASDLKGYAKTVDVKQTTDGLSASITKVQGDLSSLQANGANLLDGTAEPWKNTIHPGASASWGRSWVLNRALQGTTATLSFASRASKSGPMECYFYNNGSNHNTNVYVANVYTSQSNGADTPARRDGQAVITPTAEWKRYWITWTLSETPPVGAMTVEVGRMGAPFTADDWLEIRNVKLESGNKATDWCMSDNDVQSQLNTLSGKITATSDRLSSVYTKSEVDGKLGTKVEQSALTQTSNGLSASIAKNSKALSSNAERITQLTADVNGVKSTVSNKVDNAVYQTYVKQTAQSLSEKLTASDLNGYAKTVDVTKSIDGVKTTIADNTGKISTMQTDINGVKTTVKNAQGDIATIKTDVSGTKQTVANAQKDITSIKTSVSGVQTDITNAKKDITSVKTDISGVKTSVSNVQGDVTSLKTSVGGVQADVKNAKGDITSIKTDVSGVKTTIADHTGKITSISKTVDGLTTSVGNKVDKTTYQSYVTQTDKALSTKLTESDLQGYAKTADVKQTTDGLSASITKVQGDLNGLQIGGANMLDGSSMENTKFGDHWYNGMTCKDGWTIFTSSSANQSRRGWHYIFPVGQPGPGTYTVSLDVKLISCTSELPKGQLVIREQTTWHGYADSGELLLKVGEAVRMSATGSVPAAETKLVIEFMTSSWFVGQIAIRHAKLEKGNKATDWCMSDNDVQSQLNTLSGKITATSDRLSSVYTKSEVDGKLGTKVEQSVLTQTSNGLSASIAKNSKILSSAGLVDENAYINANRIALNGKVLMSNAVINDAFIGKISADKITTGTLNAAKVNVINIDASKITTGTLTAVEMHQSGGGADTWINKDGIHNQMGSDNVWIKEGALAAFDSIGQGMYMESGRLTLASYAYWQTNGRDDSIDYGVIKCDDDITGKKGIGIIGKGGFNLRTNNSTVSGWTGSGFIGNITAGAGIIGTDDGKMILGSLKPTFITGGQSFADDMGFEYAPFVQVGGRADQAGTDIDKNGSSVVINAWDIKLNARGKTNRNIILNRLTYNGEHSIALNDGTSDLWWGPKMHAPSFVNTSALSKKMNITKLDTQTAINAIKNTDIYDYQFKEFGETGKHYASLIIDDVNDRPQYKAAGAFVDGLGRDDGTQLGYLTVVVQNLLKEIDTLKERIDK